MQGRWGALPSKLVVLVTTGLIQGQPPPYPNQPSGFVPFAENPGVFAKGDSGGPQLLGRWRTERRGTHQSEDATAPGSPSSVLVTEFPAGLQSGRAPALWRGWDGRGDYEGQKSKFYLSLWIKICGTDYENQAVGTKMGFIGYGQDPERTAGNQGFFLLQGSGRQALGSRFRLRFQQQGHVNRTIQPNRDQRPLMSVGTWHHLEAVFELNEVGERNGVIRIWIDGTLTTDYHDVLYIKQGAKNGFYRYIWNPTWGGMGGRRTRSDAMEIDHIYLSGVPYQRPDSGDQPR